MDTWELAAKGATPPQKARAPSAFERLAKQQAVITELEEVACPCKLGRLVAW